MLKRVLAGLIVSVAMAGAAVAGPQRADVPEPGTRYIVIGVTPGGPPERES